ncbi:MAG: 1-acyl-sn-glycerol-3-phosphate acyltransferase [Proteobacteria bacterium]|nr:1-acyl-sn-glycerol-3-phosphate acyltransferase [Pseudomonadota bacterium]
MFHRLIISLIRTVANTFFRRIDVVGIENIPAEGPVIFAGNHPNALMDGWLLIAKCERWPLYFLANAKLWNYRMLVPILRATGAVPVYRREDHDGEVDNQQAFEKVYEIIESGKCMAIFPEGISHAESQLVKLKTGTARIALAVAARGKTRVKIVPCGLNYIHRHRFRSQVLIEFGEPIDVGEKWLRDYENKEQDTVRQLTEYLTQALRSVTLNAPDWRTLRFIQTARRLYKPSSADLTPGQYVELSRRFVDSYLLALDDPEMQAFRDEIENYQSRLEMLGLKDYQLRYPVTLGHAFRKIMLRGLMMLALLPLAIPGALVHLPVGWIAATVGERFSYEMDDIATLKVFATILLLPLIYLIIAIVVGMYFGIWWAAVAMIALSFSFVASVRLIEAEAGLFISMLSVLRLTRLGSEVENLRATRTALVNKVRALADRLADPTLPRMFAAQDFGKSGNK